MIKFLLISSLFSSMVFADTITLVADKWCPMNCEPNSAEEGFAVEIAKLAFKEKGYDVKYIVLPWQRAVAEVKKNNYSGIIGASIDEGDGFLFPDNPIIFMKTRIYTNISSGFNYSGADSLKNIKIGVIGGYTYFTVLQNLINSGAKNIDSVYGDKALELNFNKLSAGKIDVFFEASFIADYFLQKHPDVATNIIKKPVDDKFKGQGDIFEEKNTYNNLYIAFSAGDKNAVKYKETLDLWMKNNQETIIEIKRKYGILD
jgi:polar amino acid transport system substrate-binding protein